METRHGSREDGFSLIELLIVVAVIGVLVAIAVPTYVRAQDNAKGKAAQANVRTALSAVKALRAEHEAYWVTSDATTLAGLEAAEPSLGWGSMGDPSAGPEEISWSSTSTRVLLAVRSRSNECYYIRDDTDPTSATAGTWFGKTVAAACDADGAGPVWKHSESDGWPSAGASA